MINKYERKKTNTFQIFWFVIVFVIVYLTDSLVFALNGDFRFKAIQRYGVIILAFAILLISFYLKNTCVSYSFLILIFSITISAILSGQGIRAFSYYSLIATIVFATMFSKYCSYGKFARYFCMIMRIIAVVSLIGWIFSKKLGAFSLAPIITSPTGEHYRFFFLTNIPTYANAARRNWGPFWEPGTYQIYLNIAIYFSLFIEQDNKKIFDILLFSFTCLTTLSGAAVIPCLLFIAAYLFENKNIKSFSIVMAGIVLILVLMQLPIFSDIISKINGSSGSDSIVYRWIGIEGAWKSFIRNPLFGSSPDMNIAIKSGLALKYLGETYASNTNTLVNYFAYYGFFVGSFFAYKSYRFISKGAYSLVAKWLCFIAFFLTTSNEDLTISLFFVTLMFLKSEKIEEEGSVYVK